MKITPVYVIFHWDILNDEICDGIVMFDMADAEEMCMALAEEEIYFSFCFDNAYYDHSVPASNYSLLDSTYYLMESDGIMED